MPSGHFATESFPVYHLAMASSLIPLSDLRLYLPVFSYIFPSCPPHHVDPHFCMSSDPSTGPPWAFIRADSFASLLLSLFCCLFSLLARLWHILLSCWLPDPCLIMNFFSTGLAKAVRRLSCSFISDTSCIAYSLPWRWRQLGPLKCWWTFTSLHGDTT